MIKIKFSVEFARDYVLSKERSMRGGPIEHLRECIVNMVGPDNKVSMKGTTYTDCNMLIQLNDMSYAKFEEKLWQTLEDEFQIGKGTKNCKINLEQIDTEELAEERRVQSAYAVIQQLDGMFGAKALKELARELVAVSPQVKATEAFSVFNAKTFLFAIDDGCGLTTALKYLGKLIQGLELFEFTEGYQEIEVVVENNEKDPWAQITAVDKFKHKMISFDISSFVNHTEDPRFRKMLRRLAEIQKDYIFVFRIPGIEGIALEKMYQAIYDVMCVRLIPFPQYTYKEYFMFFERVVEKYQMQVDPNAREAFNAMMLDEKSKGSFYGFKSTCKMAKEVIYNKLVHNANNEPGDNIIRASEFGVQEVTE